MWSRFRVRELSYCLDFAYVIVLVTKYYACGFGLFLLLQSSPIIFLLHKFQNGCLDILSRQGFIFLLYKRNFGRIY